MLCMQPLLDVCRIMKNPHSTFTAGCWGGERAGCMHCWQSLGCTMMTIAMATVWAKRGWTGEKERGNWKMGLIFHAVFFVIVFWLAFFNAGWLIFYQDQNNCWTSFSCKISLPVVQIWSSHFCWAIMVWESIAANSCIRHWTRQGREPFKVIPPHLILVAQICVCILIGSPDRVIDALRQVDWLFIKFK